MSFSDVIKTAAKQAAEASAPMQIMFGTVTNANPLTVSVENRLTISGNMLIVPRRFRAGDMNTHTHETADLMETISETYTGLQIGEKVVLLRDKGGQRFMIVERM